MFNTPTCTIHSYEPSRDFLRVRDFLIQSHGRYTLNINWMLERWNYCRYFISLFLGDGVAAWEGDIRLWETAAGEIVGVAHTEGPRGEVYMQIHPDFRHLEGEMLDFGESQLAKGTDDGQRSLTVFVFEHDTEREALLQGRGYTRSAGNSYRYHRMLTAAAIPEPILPTGYTLRTLERVNSKKVG